MPSKAKISHTGLNELELYTQIANTCAAINAGALKDIELTFRAVPIKDFFRALEYFNKEKKDDLKFAELRCPETKEIMAYCFHVFPKEFPGLLVTVASELQTKVKTSNLIFQ